MKLCLNDNALRKRANVMDFELEIKGILKPHDVVMNSGLSRRGCIKTISN